MADEPAGESGDDSFAPVMVYDGDEGMRENTESSLARRGNEAGGCEGTGGLIKGSFMQIMLARGVTMYIHSPSVPLVNDGSG